MPAIGIDLRTTDYIDSAIALENVWASNPHLPVFQSTGVALESCDAIDLRISVFRILSSHK